VSNYATLADIKARLDRTDDRDDARITAIISVASRHAEQLTNRIFYTTTEARYFTADSGACCEVDDLVSLTSIETDENGDRVYERSWQATDYDLEPANSVSKGLPYTRLEIPPQGHLAFPTFRRAVKVTGVWGFPSIPAAVNEATILLAIRLLKRVDAPYGIAGSPDLGEMATLPRTDPDVMALLMPYRRFGLGAV
jgi:hypothetical protein